MRFRSIENLARVVETKEENLSPKRKRRYKLSRKFNFTDKFEDNLTRKPWLAELLNNRTTDRPIPQQNTMQNKGSNVMVIRDS